MECAWVVFDLLSLCTMKQPHSMFNAAPTLSLSSIYIYIYIHTSHVYIYNYIYSLLSGSFVVSGWYGVVVVTIAASTSFPTPFVTQIPILNEAWVDNTIAMLSLEGLETSGVLADYGSARGFRAQDFGFGGVGKGLGTEGVRSKGANASSS